MADHMTAAKLLPLLQTANSQIRHLIDDLTVAVDDDGLTQYVPRPGLLFSNLIGALIDLAPRIDAALAAAQQESQESQLIGYMSPKQLPRVVDPDDESGTYIPMRKTPRGLFTLALYSAPQQPARVALTDEQIDDTGNGLNGVQPPISRKERDRRIARAIERAHGIPGTDGAA